MLAAGAHAFLAGSSSGIGSFVKAEKYVLELVHPRIGKQQRRVVVRHQRTGRNYGMALGGKKVQELLADFTAFHLLTESNNRKAAPRAASGTNHTIWQAAKAARSSTNEVSYRLT